MWRTYISQDPRLGVWYERVQGRPGWVWKTTLLVTAAVVLVPLVVAALAVFLLALAVFTVLSLVAAGVAFVQRLVPGRGPGVRGDGRRNVRVIQR